MAIDRKPGLEADETTPTDATAPDTAPLVPMMSIVPPPSGWTDAMTGTDGPRYWDRLLLSETARIRRYKRSATVVLIEFAGLDRLAWQWGQEVGERTLLVVARALAAEIRPSDHIARIETVRFGVLLTETSEIEAINFVERARSTCERELSVASELVTVGFGWASPPPKQGLRDALAIAERRLAAELAAS